MNRIQKLCLWFGIAVIVLMGLFPPWFRGLESDYRYKYSFLFRPPVSVYSARMGMLTPYRLDTHRLHAQWFMVAVVTGGLMLTFHGRKTKPRTSDVESGGEEGEREGMS